MRLRNGVIPGVNDHPGVPRSSRCGLSPRPDTKCAWQLHCPTLSRGTRVHRHLADVSIRGYRLRDEPTCVAVSYTHLTLPTILLV